MSKSEKCCLPATPGCFVIMNSAEWFHFLSELMELTWLGLFQKHFNFSKLLFRCYSTHVWIVDNIKSKFSDPLTGHPSWPSSREAGHREELCLAAYHAPHPPSPSHSPTTALPPPFSLPALQRQLKQMLCFFFFSHSQVTFILTNIYLNQCILIEANGS